MNDIYALTLLHLGQAGAGRQIGLGALRWRVLVGCVVLCAVVLPLSLMGAQNADPVSYAEMRGPTP